MANLSFGRAYNGSPTSIYNLLIADYAAAIQQENYTSYFTTLSATESAFVTQSKSSGSIYTFQGSFAYADGVLPLSASSVTGISVKTAANEPVVAATGLSYTAWDIANATLDGYTTAFNALPWQVTGSTGNDSMQTGSGNDVFDGGAGLDQHVLTAASSNFTVTKTSTGFTTTDRTGALGTDTLQNVERVRFSDKYLALDLGVNQSAGQAALLLGAVLPQQLAFDASKQALRGAAIGLFDAGYNLSTLSGALLRLPIWESLAGGSDATSIARYLLTNVNGQAPDAASVSAAATTLQNEQGTSSQGVWLADLALSTANQTHVSLTGLASNGMDYS